jgi:hypothetical protein
MYSRSSRAPFQFLHELGIAPDSFVFTPEGSTDIKPIPSDTTNFEIQLSDSVLRLTATMDIGNPIGTDYVSIGTDGHHVTVSEQCGLINRHSV